MLVIENCNSLSDLRQKFIDGEEVRTVRHEPWEDAISRQAVLDAIDVKAWEFCDYLISKNRNDEQKPVSHFADNLRECVREELPSVTPQPKTGYISIDDVMSVFDDFMCGEVDEDDTDTFLKMLKDKAESES